MSISLPGYSGLAIRVAKVIVFFRSVMSSASALKPLATFSGADLCKLGLPWRMWRGFWIQFYKDIHLYGCLLNGIDGQGTIMSCLYCAHLDFESILRNLFQNCPEYCKLRKKNWPTEVAMIHKLYGIKEELQKRLSLSWEQKWWCHCKKSCSSTFAFYFPKSIGPQPIHANLTFPVLCSSLSAFSVSFSSASN